MTSAPQQSIRSYDGVAWCYDGLASAWSLGRIGRAKAWQVESVKPRDRVLYVGIGSGEEAVLAARRGARVTGIDVSPAMLRRARRRLAAEGAPVDLVRADLFDFEVGRPFDVVAANFVLNIFAPETMRAALARAASLVRPGGLLMLADFAPPGEGRASRWLSSLHYGPVLLAARGLGLCRLHPIYDYGALLEPLGFELVTRAGFGLGPDGSGPALYASWVAARRS